jgi:hypothetical protein
LTTGPVGVVGADGCVDLEPRWELDEQLDVVALVVELVPPLFSVTMY